MVRTRSTSYVFFLLICGLTYGCITVAEHQRELSSARERDMTVGIVQKEIRVGMSQADVALALGSPNIVTNDGSGKETWIYDKIATEASYSASSGGVSGGAGAGGLAGSALILGGVRGGYYKSAGAYGSTQRTLTVVIKFDDKKKVESFSYHASKFYNIGGIKYAKKIYSFVLSLDSYYWMRFYKYYPSKDPARNSRISNTYL